MDIRRSCWQTRDRVEYPSTALMLEEELQWATNPLSGASEDRPPSGGKPSEVEVGEEPTAIPRSVTGPARITNKKDTMNTLLMIKPEIVEQGLVGEILTIIQRNRFRIRRMEMTRFDRARAERFYEIHKGRDFYPGLVDYITSGPVVVIELEGEEAVERLRILIGNTDPSRAAPGTIRYVYGTSIQRNAVHASDSPESAKKELAIAFDAT